MSISVRKLYKNSKNLYQMELIAGEEGLQNNVQWVHILEEQDAQQYLNGGELVFTMGMQCDGEEWLLKFARSLVEFGASALVINLGDFIEEVPESLVTYCQENNFPLFTIPWESRVVDMTKDFCQRIMKNDEQEEHETTAMKNLLFGTGNLENDIATLLRYGYQRVSEYNFLVISGEIDVNQERQIERLKRMTEQCARRINDNFMTFSYDTNRVVVLINYSREETNQLAENIISEGKDYGMSICIGIGTGQKGLADQSDNFHNAMSALELCSHVGKQIIFYDDLDVYKLLMSIEDKNKLKDYYEGTLARIEEYDEENGTKLFSILEIYLENDGSPQAVADKLFLHRNTVNNQLKKIEKLTGFNPLKLNDKLKLYLAFYVRNLLS